MKILKYPGPMLAPDEGGGEGTATSLDNLLNNFESAQGDDGAGDEGSGDGDAGDNDGDGGDGGDGDSGNTDDGQATKDNPNNVAFARQRVAIKELTDSNKNMSALIERMAKAMGFEGENINDLMTKLDDDALQKTAEKDKIPVEVLKRLQQLEGRDQQFQEQQLRAAAQQGFNDLQDEFELTKDELLEFAGQLDQAALNPFQKQVDIRGEFLKRNMKKIIEKEVQKARARDDKGSTHGSNPGDKSGGGSGDEKKITTVQGLNSLLKGLDL